MSGHSASENLHPSSRRDEEDNNHNKINKIERGQVMEILPDDVADLVLSNFDALEKKRKPLVREGGVKEWVPLSGIVAQRLFKKIKEGG